MLLTCRFGLHSTLPVLFSCSRGIEDGCPRAAYRQYTVSIKAQMPHYACSHDTLSALIIRVLLSTSRSIALSAVLHHVLLLIHTEHITSFYRLAKASD